MALASCHGLCRWRPTQRSEQLCSTTPPEQQSELVVSVCGARVDNDVSACSQQGANLSRSQRLTSPGHCPSPQHCVYPPPPRQHPSPLGFPRVVACDKWPLRRNLKVGQKSLQNILIGDLGAPLKECRKQVPFVLEQNITCSRVLLRRSSGRGSRTEVMAKILHAANGCSQGPTSPQRSVRE